MSDHREYLIKIAHLSDLHFAGPLFSFYDLAWESKRVREESSLLIQKLKQDIKLPVSFLKRMHPFRHTLQGEMDTVTMRRLLALKSRAFRTPFVEKTIRWLFKDLREMDVHHVILTGDMTASARPSEFKAAQQFMKNLAQQHTITLIPGNHDLLFPIVYSPLITHAERIKFFQKYLGAYLFSDELYGIKKSAPFPQVHLVSDKIVVIGLDSTEIDRLDLESGGISEQQFERLERLLMHEDIRNRSIVVALHHPLTDAPSRLTTGFTQIDRTIRAWGNNIVTAIPESSRLLELVSSYNCSLILHGHKHQEYSVQYNGIQLHCAGTSLHPDLLKGEPPGYTIFSYFNDEWSTERRQYPKSLLFGKRNKALKNKN